MIRFVYYFNEIMKNCFRKTSITHKKYLTLQLKEDSDPFSAKSAVQIFALNLAYTFLLLNFLITGM